MVKLYFLASLNPNKNHLSVCCIISGFYCGKLKFTIFIALLTRICRHFMLKSAVKSISGRYNVEEKTDFYKVIGFHLFIGFGAIAGLIMFLVDLIGSSANACLPGDISVLILFGVSFYGLRQISFNWAVRVFFLVPVVPYLFFVSGSIAIIPNQQSIPYTLWSLVPFFFYFLIFSDKKRDLVVFWVLSILTLFIHTTQAGLFNFVLNFKWDGDIHFINPFLTLTAFFFLTILLSFRFQNKIDYLHQQKEETDQLINQVSRSLPQGLM